MGEEEIKKGRTAKPAWENGDTENAVQPEQKKSEVADMESKLAGYEKMMEEMMKQNAELAKKMEELERKNAELAANAERPVMNEAREKAPVNAMKGIGFTLPNETVFVKFIEKKRGFVGDKESPLFGGMAETASKNFVVPRLRNGNLVNILTDDERRYFEEIFKMPEGGLSIYNSMNKNGRENYWLDSTSGATNSVQLTKNGMRLYLNNPHDYIRYKILLANTSTICPSMDALKRNPKNTYLFVIVNERTSEENALLTSELKMACYAEFKKYKDDKRTMKFIAEKMGNRRLSSDVKMEYLYTFLDGQINENPKMFNDIVMSKTLATEALLMDALDYGVVNKINGRYYRADTGDALCEANNQSYYDVVIRYLSDGANRETRDDIEVMVKKKKL